jgi:hypothetical protein
MKRLLLLLLALTVCGIASASADENVRAAQTRLKEGGFFFGEPNGTYNSETAAAVSRYQIRNGLQITWATRRRDEQVAWRSCRGGKHASAEGRFGFMAAVAEDRSAVPRAAKRRRQAARARKEACRGASRSPGAAR